ncbi:hypothetical protein [Streptomyces sp. NPDC050504]|uniref:hypothetical protein n=1 Tax=Streptomyces sp. NPDC050504 TaxID=3365618 RepID=UPI0037B8A4D2
MLERTRTRTHVHSEPGLHTASKAAESRSFSLGTSGGRLTPRTVLVEEGRMP